MSGGSEASGASRANWLVLHLFIVYRNWKSDGDPLPSGLWEEVPCFLRVGEIPIPFL